MNDFEAMPDGVDKTVRHLLLTAVGLGASDLHLLSGYPPTCRVHGRLRPLEEQVLQTCELTAMLESLCPTAVLGRFRDQLDADFSLELASDGRALRFRANFFSTRESMAACFRLIPNVIPDFEWAGFPRALARRIVQFRNGLVLV